MPIVGMNVRNLDARREDALQGDINVDTNPRITGINETNIDTLGEDGLEIEYEFSCDYRDQNEDESVANITMTGIMVFLPEEENPEEILERWEEDEEIPVDVFLPVINGIIRRCTTRAVGIADELSLPAPVRIPSVRIKSPEETTRYIG